MVDIFNQVWVVVLGVTLLFNGFRVIKTGRFEVGVGRPRPLITFSLTGRGSRIVGLYSVFSGLILLLYMGALFASLTSVSKDIAFSLGITALFGLLILSLVIGVFQKLRAIRETTERNSD